jgi:metal-responsive CopG/Arc/MetJ family transcriptional regulator
VSPKTGGRGKWVSVGIPKEIAERIDKVIDSRQWGFRSRNDYVLEAVKMDLRTRGYYP